MDIFQLVSFKLNSQITPKWMKERLDSLPTLYWDELVKYVKGFAQEYRKENYELCVCAAYLRSPTQGPIEGVIEWSMDNLKSLGYHFVDVYQKETIINYQFQNYKNYGGMSDMSIFRIEKEPLTTLPNLLNPMMEKLPKEGEVAQSINNLEFYDLVNSLRRILKGSRYDTRYFSKLDRIPVGFFMESTKNMDFMNWTEDPFN